MQANHNNSRERGLRRILAILAVGIHLPGFCFADEPLTVADNVALPGAIEIEGDTIQLRLDRQMRATGNAVIRKGGQQISGDDIRYDLLNDELQVEGNVSINGGRAEIKGPILKMRLSENIGEMRDVTIEFKPAPPDQNAPEAPPALLSDQALFVSDPKRYLEDSQASSALSRRSPFENSRGSAKLILFEGQDKKTLKSASYTTCPADVDDWYIKAGSMEMNDYTSTGKAKNAYVEFKGYPILYTPYMSFSYNNQRKSGFLSPLIGSTSRSGFQVLTPYYINISPDMDATIATNVLSRRGTQLQGEFRYLGETYSGVDDIEYLDKDSLTGQTRYYAKLTHKQQFNEHWSGGYSYEQVSDNQYFSDLATRIITTSRVNLGQGGYLNYQDEHWSFSGVVQRYQNLDNISYVYQRLPQLTFSYSNEWQGLKTYDYAQVTYFDSLAQAGTVPTGLRTVVNPSISYPMKSSYGYITPKIGVHSTNYDLNNNLPVGYNQQYNQLQRTLPIFSVDSALYFDKQSEFFGTSFTQTIEPRMMYLYIPYQNQNMFPVFDSARKTLNLTSLFSENQFGGNDRVNNANQVTMAVTSRLIDTETGIERISTTFGQQYYLSDSKVILPTETVSPYGKSSLIAGATARLSNRLNVDTFFQYDPNQSKLQRSNFAIRYNPEPGKNFDFGYRRTVGVLDQFNASGQWPLGNRWYAVGRYNYSFYDVKLIESMAGLEYDAGCWVGRMVMQRYATATASANTAIFFQLELGGLTSIGSNPLTVIRRDIPTYMRSVDVPSVYRDQNTQ